MSDFTNEAYELGWDAVVENNGTEFIVAENGDYTFTVVNFERARFAGSAKMRSCGQAKLTLRLDMPENIGVCDVKCNLFLLSNMQWKIHEFGVAIGQLQKGIPGVLNWNAIMGARGRCKVSKRSFKSKNSGGELWTNNIDKFYAPEDGDLPYTTGNLPQGGYSAPQGNPAPSATPSWQGGKF